MGPRVPGRGRQCEHARPLLFLSPAAASAAEPLEGKRPSCQPPVASISPPLESLLGPVASLHGRNHLLLSFPRCYPGPVLLAIATGRIRSRSCQLSPAPLLLRHLTLPRVPYCPTASWIPERARRAPGSLSLQKRDVPSRPGSCSRGRRPSWATVVPGARPQPPPSEVCRPPLPGWGEVRLGAVGGWGSSLASGARRAWAGCWRHNEWDPGTARKSSFS